VLAKLWAQRPRVLVVGAPVEELNYVREAILKQRSRSSPFFSFLAAQSKIDQGIALGWRLDAADAELIAVLHIKDRGVKLELAHNYRDHRDN